MGDRTLASQKSKVSRSQATSTGSPEALSASDFNSSGSANRLSRRWGEYETPRSGLVGSLARLPGVGVTQEVSLLRPAFRALGFVDKEVGVPGILDDGLAGTGVRCIDHRRTSLGDVEAHALEAVGLSCIIPSRYRLRLRRARSGAVGSALRAYDASTFPHSARKITSPPEL
jgi:hypothetical protein